MNHSELLNKIYDSAVSIAFDEKTNFENIDNAVKKYVEYIISRSESNKGMVTVLTTLLAHKIIAPEQDIRFHQAGLENGFAGRGIDQNHVTPFMKKLGIMAGDRDYGVFYPSGKLGYANVFDPAAVFFYGGCCI
ncbi:MAG: hypothetical protein FWF80_02290, partial [Defluviitaleaceae bacterium]|nr:hypothetical protein [Defluviitaleaceae bacterium]